MRRIELTDDEFGWLIVALGMAMGETLKQQDAVLARNMLRLANAVNRDNPNWRIYEIPEEEHA